MDRREGLVISDLFCHYDFLSLRTEMSFNIYETVGGELNFYFRAVLSPDYGGVTY